MDKQVKLYDESEFKEVTSNFFKFEVVGDNIQGKVIEIGEGDYGKVYTIVCPSGEEFKLPSNAVLVRKLDRVKVGDIIRAEYTGDEKNPKTRNTYKTFKVGIITQ